MLKLNIKTKRKVNQQSQDNLKRFDKEGTKAPFLKYGYPDEKVDPEVAFIAAVQEFGKWPFMRKAIIENKNVNKRELFKLGKKAINGKKLSQLLEKYGNNVVGQVKASIDALNDPPLDEKTIKEKGNDRILRGKKDRIYKSIAYVLKKGRNGKIPKNV